LRVQRTKVASANSVAMAVARNANPATIVSGYRPLDFFLCDRPWPVKPFGSLTNAPVG
jgi:hypothetical protein